MLCLLTVCLVGSILASVSSYKSESKLLSALIADALQVREISHQVWFDRTVHHGCIALMQSRPCAASDLDAAGGGCG